MKLKFYLRTAKVITILTIIGILFNRTTRDFITTRQNWFIPKMTFAFFAVAFIDIYLSELRNLYKKLRNLEWTKLAFQLGDFHTLDGIPVRKLLHILESTNWLLYKTFIQEVSQDRQLYDKLSSNLERAWILTRWEKNARILNSSFNSNQIYSILSSASDSDLICDWIIKVWESSYEFITK
jgi:hypothetical protein